MKRKKGYIFISLNCVVLFTYLICISASASRLQVSAGTLELPASEYHYLAYGLGWVSDGFSVSLGLNHPSVGGSYSQWLGHVGVAREWSMDSDFMKPFVAPGLGFVMDRVNGLPGIIPAILLLGGTRLGGDRFGVQLEMLCYLGVNNPSDFLRFVIWPVTLFQVGVYWGK